MVTVKERQEDVRNRQRIRSDRRVLASRLANLTMRHNLGQSKNFRVVSPGYLSPELDASSVLPLNDPEGVAKYDARLKEDLRRLLEDGVFEESLAEMPGLPDYVREAAQFYRERILSFSKKL